MGVLEQIGKAVLSNQFSIYGAQRSIYWKVSTLVFFYAVKAIR